MTAAEFRAIFRVFLAAEKVVALLAEIGWSNNSHPTVEVLKEALEDYRAERLKPPPSVL